jgi:hypothetical protein
VTILCILTFKAYLKVKNAALKHWGLCIWIFILFISYNPYYYPLSVEPVSVYYWLFAGILLKLPEISDKLEDDARFSQKKIKWRIKRIFIDNYIISRLIGVNRNDSRNRYLFPGICP